MDTLHSSLCHPLLRFWCSGSPSLKCSDFMYPIFVFFDKEPAVNHHMNNNNNLTIGALRGDRNNSQIIGSVIEPIVDFGVRQPDHIIESSRSAGKSTGVEAGIPGIKRIPVSELVSILGPLVAKGLKSVLLFAYVPDMVKDSRGSAADDPSINPALMAVTYLSRAFPRLLIACDLCLCNFTDHGHCGILKQRNIESLNNHDGFENESTLIASNNTCGNSRKPKRLKLDDTDDCIYGSEDIKKNITGMEGARDFLDNFASVARLVEIGLAYSRAGAHVVAPSDMMDGRIGALKRALIAHRLEGRTAVMSYSAKFASALYGPFRDMVGCKIDSRPRSAVEGGSSCLISNDRSSYQLPVGSAGLALRCLERDVREGADILMVKPASFYLDIVKSAKTQFPTFPLAVYHVSGEYTMLYHAAQAGCIDLETTLVELILCMKRAGADIIITYFTPLLLDILAKTYNFSASNHQEILGCMTPTNYPSDADRCPFASNGALMVNLSPSARSTIFGSVDSGIITSNLLNPSTGTEALNRPTESGDTNGHNKSCKPSHHMNEMLFL